MDLVIDTRTRALTNDDESLIIAIGQVGVESKRFDLSNVELGYSSPKEPAMRITFKIRRSDGTRFRTSTFQCKDSIASNLLRLKRVLNARTPADEGMPAEVSDSKGERQSVESLRGNVLYGKA